MALIPRGRLAKRAGSRSKMEQRILQGLFNGVDAWQYLVEGRASELAPVATSRLAKSIHADPNFPIEIEVMIVVGQVGTNVEYARAHELGSGIHALNPADRELIEIEAGFWTGKSNKKALNFPWPAGPTTHPAYNATGPYAGTFTFRKIYHPGVPAANQGEGYLRLAAKQSQEEGRRIVLQAVINELARP